MEPPHIFYRGCNGEIFEVFWDEQSNTYRFNQWNYPGFTEAPPAADDSDPVIVEYGTALYVFYRGERGEICDIFWDKQSNAFGFYQLNCGGLTPAPPAVDDPIIKEYLPGLHIFYRGYYRIIIEVFLDKHSNTFGSNQWNSGPAPPASGNPTSSQFK